MIEATTYRAKIRSERRDRHGMQDDVLVGPLSDP